MLKITETTWNTRIDKSHLTQVSNPINFCGIDYSNPTQSRKKGIQCVSQGTNTHSHLDNVILQMGKKKAQGLAPVDVPLVVEKNPSSSGKPWRLVLGHHRLRALMHHGYTSYPFLTVSFPPGSPGRIAARKFSIFNNDHSVTAMPNCHDTVKDEINNLFLDLAKKGVDIHKDKRMAKREVKKDAKEMFGNNYNDNQLDRLIGNWFERVNATKNEWSKYKAYSPTDARRTGCELLGIPIPPKKGNRKHVESEGQVVIAMREDDCNLDQPVGWARVLKAANPDVKIHLVIHTSTHKIADDAWLSNRRNKMITQLEDLRKSQRRLFKKQMLEVLEKANVSLVSFPMNAIPDDFDAIHFLPQICKGKNKEDENQLLPGPW